MTFLKTTALALVLSAGLFIGSSHAAFRDEGDFPLTKSRVTSQITDIVGQSLAKKQKAAAVMAFLVAHDYKVDPAQVNSVKKTIDTASVEAILKGFGVKFSDLPEEAVKTIIVKEIVKEIVPGSLNATFELAQVQKQKAKELEKERKSLEEAAKRLNLVSPTKVSPKSPRTTTFKPVADELALRESDKVCRLQTQARDLEATLEQKEKEFELRVRQLTASLKEKETELAASKTVKPTISKKPVAVDLTEELKAVKAQLLAAQREIEEQDKEATDGTHLQEELKELNAELKSEVEELEKDLAKQARTIATAESDLNLADEKREEAVAKVQALLDTDLEEKAQLKADLEAAKKVKPAAVTDLVVDHSEELDAVKAQLAKVQAQLEAALEAAKKPAVVTTPAVDTKELDAVRAQLSEVQGQLDATRSAIDDATRAKTEALAQIELLKQELAAEKVKPRLATAGSLQSVTSSADATELALWKSAVKGMVIRSKRLALPDSELTPELLATLVAKTMDAVKVANTPFSPSKRK